MGDRMPDVDDLLEIIWRLRERVEQLERWCNTHDDTLGRHQQRLDRLERRSPPPIRSAPPKKTHQ